jgi:hypothetical protein
MLTRLRREGDETSAPSGEYSSLKYSAEPEDRQGGGESNSIV